jgi:hypothetical protein
MKTEKINLTKLFKIGILFFGISLLLWNCEKDEVLIENTVSINLEKVKSIYKIEFNQKEFFNLKNEPLWDEAKILYNNDREYIEIPFRIVKQKELDKSTSMSNDRLLAFISPDNKLTVNIVHYFAQDIKKSIPDFQNLSYFNVGNFNGFVTLYDLDKNLISLNKFNDGIKSSKQYTIYKKKKNDDNVFYRMPTDCEMHTETIVTESCWFWYYHNTGTTEIISCDYDYNTVTYQTCDTNGGGGSGGSTSETTIIEEEIVEIFDEELEGKAKCVSEKLKNISNGYKSMIKNFDGEFPVSHLKLRNSSSLPNNINAKTYPPSNYVITIDINENNLNRPNLSIARTFIHETIHAEMFRKIMSILDNGGDLNGLTKSEWTQKLSQGDYPGIFDYYSRYGVNGMQHQQMASHYISTISNYLEQFEPGLSSDIYTSLAWTGLKNTVAWKELKSDTLNINNTIRNFNSQGSESCN